MPKLQADTLQATAAADSAAQAAAEAAAAPSWAPVPFEACTEPMAPFSRADRELYHTSAPGWLRGIDAPLRRQNIADNPGVLSLIVGLFVLIGFNMNHVRRLFRSLPQKLWSVRRRGNAFDDTTSNETRSFVLLLVLLCLTQGVLLFQWLGIPAGSSAFGAVAALTALAGGYYIFQLCACSLVGFVFTDQAGAASWRRGLNASAALLGVALAVPAVVSLFYPAVTGAMLVAAATLYVMARIAFIAKGFRIFYRNFLSLLYFILYLCTLEIIPVIVLYVSATEICKTI